MINKQIFLYVVLVGMIGFFTFLLATAKYETPDAHSKKLIEEITAEVAPVKSGADTMPAQTMYQNLGTKDVFASLIPKPTPMPTPEKTAIPPPPLPRIIGTWKLTMILDTEVSFENSANRETWNMKIGEVKQVKYLNQDCDIVLKSIDMNNFVVKVKFGEQETDISMKF